MQPCCPHVDCLFQFQSANAEAARKIMKKHAKRTALPSPRATIENVPSLDFSQGRNSISHILIVTLTESLLPIIPHIDDYLCLICTSLAFKPIRLSCRRKRPLFCVFCRFTSFRFSQTFFAFDAWLRCKSVGKTTVRCVVLRTSFLPIKVMLDFY